MKTAGMVSLILLASAFLLFGQWRSSDGPMPVSDPPPAVVRICGENGNGVWVRHEDSKTIIESLLAQGCFAEDIRIVYYDKEWAFIYGTYVLIGE